MLVYGDLVGHPFAEGGRDPAIGGLDCWGLVRIVLARLGVAVPLYGETVWQDASDDGAVAARALDEAAAWAPVHPWRDARPGDVALLNVLGRPIHVGVVIGWPDMLHAHKVSGAVVVDRLTGPHWRHRIAGIYRHPALA